MSGPHHAQALDPAVRRRMQASAAACALLVVGMGGLAFAAPPLYRLFCQVTGFGGVTQVAEAAPDRILDREILVRFDTNTASDLPLRFAPEERAMRLRLGETGVAFFTVTNVTDKPVVAVAGYNVTPHKTGKYFAKLQCFCFADMTIAPGQSQRLPVMFFVDPELASDPDTEEVGAVTLSYTFYGSMRAAQEALRTGS